MTREEAEIYARNMSYEDALFNLTKARATPYKKATLIKVYELIKALSQEPCDDAVSRKDAEQMFRNIRSHLKPQDYKSAEEFNTRDLMLLNAEQMIHALPSVTPQNHGKMLVCPSCGLDVHSDFKYCPRCGRKMQESEDQ